MLTQYELDRAILSLLSYDRTTINQTNRPSGYEITDQYNDPDSGFAAVSFFNAEKQEHVISFRGTDEAADWPLANGLIAFGLPSPQMLRALEFVAEALAITSLQPGWSWDKVSFTGHSLGGGIASLMAVYFDRPAAVFDSAPFANSAVGIPGSNTSSFYFNAFVDASRSYPGVPSEALAAFSDYSRIAGFTYLEYPSRRQQVRSIFLRGEALEPLRMLLPEIRRSASDPSDVVSIFGSSSGLPNPVSMHSIELFNLLVRSPAFRDAVPSHPGCAIGSRVIT